MLCQTCKRKSDCLPAALAAGDAQLYALLEGLKGCDRYLAPKPTTAKTSSAKRQLLQMFTRHPA
ncbi:MAG: hypothetical protein F6K00_07550 [Leptolyngbya sp. SIOISBB]|nr:hypothetical protein [Leptolyngbya sp. SIOISBB]